MSSAATAAKDQSSVKVAIIGLLGIIAGAFFGNFDKLFPPKNQIVSAYSGYAPTGVFETELRYYFEVLGLRDQFKSQQDVMYANAEKQLEAAAPDDKKIVQNFKEFMNRDMPSFDEVLDMYIPLYKKYFTITQIQKLNKFFSTPTMQDFVQKSKFLAVDQALISAKIQNDTLAKLQIFFKEDLSSKEVGKAH